MSDRARLRLVTFGLPTLTIVLLVAIAMGLFLQETNSDALIPALISTHRLTFFYWGQDRLASVVPALAWPVRHEIWNFYVQSAILGSSFFALILLFVRFHLRETRGAAAPVLASVATLATGLLVMALIDPITGYTFVFEQPYAISTVLFLVGMRGLMARPAGVRLGGAGLVVVAALLNPLVVLLCPVAFSLRHESRGARRAVEAMLVAGAALVVSMCASRWFYDGPPQSSLYRQFSVRRMIDDLPTAISKVAVSVHFVPGALAMGVAVAWLVARRSALSTNLRLAYLGAPLFGVVWLILFSGNRWVEINVHSPRYFFPLYWSALLLIAGAVAEAAAIIANRMADRGSTRQVSTALVVAYALLALAATVGLIRASSIPVLERSEQAVDVARTNHVQLVAGSYWDVWPAVLRGRSEGLELLGIADRSAATVDQILDVVNDELTSNGDVDLVCVDPDPQLCVDHFSYVTDRPWTMSSGLGPPPYVIAVVPVQP